MQLIFKRWGAICLILGSLLMGSANTLVSFELVAATAFIHSAVLWGHAFLALGFVGFAISVMNDGNRTKVMGGLFLILLGSVLLGALIGTMILESAGLVTGTVEQIAFGNALFTANLMGAHFGYVIGLLLLLVTALGSSNYSKNSIYVFMLATVLVGVGPFTPEMIFGIGFALSLVGGVWVGKELLDSTASTVPAHGAQQPV